MKPRFFVSCPQCTDESGFDIQGSVVNICLLPFPSLSPAQWTFEFTCKYCNKKPGYKSPTLIIESSGAAQEEIKLRWRDRYWR